MKTNPYSPPTCVDSIELEPVVVSIEITWPRVAKSFARWSVICAISAIPSFWGGLATGSSVVHIAAMLLGIFLFVCGYTCADFLFIRRAVLANRQLKRALRIGYGTRLVASIIVPLGLMIDLWFGLLSLSIVGFFSGPVHQLGRQPTHELGVKLFSAVLATTLVQGVLLNIVLAGYMAIVYAILVNWPGRKTGLIPAE